MQSRTRRPKPPIRLASNFLAVVLCGRGYRVCDGIEIAGKAKETVAQINATPGQPRGFRAKAMPVELVFPGQ